ncbi:MAG: hypothetical protein F4X68_09730 [Acidimicrobiia bacterium]|nr:hypothetical protein [Acidimicrobiia bacterium]MXZ86536.1 hypothetical protein [Acidimicrobiia bacterium]MYB11463.1 hypothetical protein [Acidimicrobiia bacterium]MYB74225.1 hypothetical protein [Acidimicrobiia bacterium]MYE73304.1 hypothetical protein [Acidimicrobiia bacterium]
MSMIEHIFRRRDLGIIDSLIGAGMLAVAVFMWAERSVEVDANAEGPDNWKWQLWQMGSVVLAIVGVWLMWRNTSKVPWVRTVCLTALAVAYLLNNYTDIFKYSGNIWNTVNPLFIACATVAICTGWRRVMAQRQGMEPANPFVFIAAVISTGMAVAVFVNAYFTNDSGAWNVLDPLIILSLLIWASAARRTNVGDAI